MKKRTAILIGTIVLIAAMAVPFAWAGPGRHRGGHDALGGFGMMRLEHARQELDLSDAQVDQIRAIFKDLHDQHAANREQMRGGIHEAAKALIADPNNIAAAQAVLDQQLANERTMKSNALTAFSKALNILTPEQRTKLSTLMTEREARHRE
ncbi:MAG TPA: periplasmic heavy metal sensor [Thermoanaerobaculia bacterium]|jgi:Spy/CpxP family protein refolding chaperone|nr:periplasmic heavy metal sensor [Thermoanaerobaculia bacterium]